MKQALGFVLVTTLPVAVAIGIATLMPAQIANAAPGGDKLHHFLAFGLLVLPAALVRPRWAVPAVLLAIFYGYLIELIQPHFGRTYDLADLRADAIGALCGAGLGVVLGWLMRRLGAATALCRRLGNRP